MTDSDVGMASEVADSDVGADTRSLRPSMAISAPTLAEASSLSGVEIELPAELSHVASVPGAAIGRYIVLETLGEGAMGHVVRAYDPKLGREVAVKQVKAWASDTVAEERLEREARAMAKLSHPNVVTVYDVEVDANRVLMVMEYVSGVTLKEWLRQTRTQTQTHNQPRPRPWREVLSICIQAGRGLAAAHTAGLVHRDFKPGNVLIGADGRARVTDFGLARVPGEGSFSDGGVGFVAVSEVDVGDEPLTRTGAVVGTPAYMAPEQHAGTAADERADQYAFCVTVWEGLFGKRPFRTDLARRKREGPPEAPRGHGVPRRVAEALRRGMAPAAADRWPSMHALLDALARVMGRRRRVWIGTLGVTAAASLAAVLLRPGPQQCTGASDHLQEVWGPTQQQQVETALRGTGVGYADAAWDLVRTELDGYGEAWTTMHTEACEATVRGEQSNEALDLRMACLHRARDEVRGAVGVLSRADATVVAGSRKVVTSLPRLAHCEDLEALRAERPPAEDPKTAEAVEQLRWQLAELSWMRRAGQYEQALGRISLVRRRADALGHDRLRADVRMLHGDLLAHQAHYPEAEQSLREALRLALEQGQRATAIEAIVTLLDVVGAQQSRPHEAHWLATMGMGLARRWRLGDEQVAALHRGRGIVLSAEGELEQAEQAHREGLELLLRSHGETHLDVVAARLSLAQVLEERSKLDEAESIERGALAQYVSKLGPSHPDVAHVHAMLGRTLAKQGRYAEAEQALREALALLESALGDEHPAVAEAANQLGTALYDQARYDDAEQAYLRALRIYEGGPATDGRGAEGSDRPEGAPQSTGPAARNPKVPSLLSNLAQIEWRRGRLDAAETYARRALTVAVALQGPDHPDVGRLRNNLAILLKSRGQLAEAEQELLRVLEIYRAALGFEHPRVAAALLNLGNLRAQQKRFTEARTDHARALRITEAALGPEHPQVAMSLFNLGVVELQLGERTEARAHCGRALEVYRTVHGGEHPDLGMPLACLAQIASDEGRHEDAIGHYREAIGLQGSAGGTAGTRPDLLLGLGQALWSVGRRDEAREEMRHALQSYEGREGSQPLREEIEAWLAEHGG